MKRVAVFGNAGGGKSTLARRLAELPLYPLDLIQFRPGGGALFFLRPYRRFWMALAAGGVCVAVTGSRQSFSSLSVGTRGDDASRDGGWALVRSYRYTPISSCHVSTRA